MNARERILRLPVLIEALGFIPVIKLGPRTVHFHTVRESREGDFQPDRKTSQVCKGAVLRIDVSTAAQGDYSATGIGRFLQVTLFEGSEVWLSVFLKYVSDLPFFALFDFSVEIDELPAELPRQLAADCRLARTHKPDKVNPAVLHSGPL